MDEYCISQGYNFSRTEGEDIIGNDDPKVLVDGCYVIIKKTSFFKGWRRRNTALTHLIFKKEFSISMKY